jgi:hypothetical protein
MNTTALAVFANMQTPPESGSGYDSPPTLLSVKNV